MNLRKIFWGEYTYTGKLNGGMYEYFGYRRTDEMTDGSGFIRSQGES